MNERGKSDSPILPEKLPNNDWGAPQSAEGVEGRGLAKGNPVQQTRPRTQSRKDLQQALERIRQAAQKDRKLQLTALWHHVYDGERTEPNRSKEPTFRRRTAGSDQSG